MGSREIAALVKLLNCRAPGKIPEGATADILRLLADCWDDLTGSNEASMEVWKLCRAENLNWVPPLLMFNVERHGATVLGSSRAELQRWEVNIEAKTAFHTRSGFRQLYPTSPRLDVRPIANRICEFVRSGSSSDAKVMANVIRIANDRVKIRPAAFIPGGGYAQTVAGRRSRLKAALESQMQALGWILDRRGIWLEFHKDLGDK